MQAQETTSQYQQNLGVVLRRQDGRVLMCRRSGGGDYTWQFPERALCAAESFEAGISRVVREDLGLEPPQQRCRLAGRGPAVRQLYCKPTPRHVGKEHTFFLLDLAGDDADIAAHNPDFDAWRWFAPEEALELILPARREAARATLEASAPTPQPA